VIPVVPHGPDAGATFGPFRAVDCFQGISGPETSDLAGLFDRHRFRRGAPIVASDTPADRIYLVMSGRVRLFFGSAGGREITFDVVEGGGVFGISSVFGFGTGLDSLRAVAITDSTICIGGRETVRALSRWPHVLQNIALQMGTRILHVEQELEDLASVDARTRLARALHHLAAEEATADGSRRITRRLPHVTHEELGRQTGASRETVTRLLSRLCDEGHIHREGRRIVIHDTDGFRQAFGLVD
jgi:CRP-like cAMP-binding protein